MSARRRRLALAAALAGLLLGGALLRSPAPAAGAGTPTARPPAPVAAVAGLATGADRARAAAPRAPMQAAPSAASQAGSLPDGALALDADGRLVIDLALRRRFDWHRSALGELDEATVRRRLAHDLHQLPQAAQLDALVLYDRYLDLLAASERVGDPIDPLASLDRLRALRRQLLGDAVADAFFADEELALEARLLRRQLLADRRLDPAQRAARLAAIDERLPAALRPSAELAQVEDAIALDALHAAAGSAAGERHADRAALFGEPAADRLAALDRARAEWQHRVAEYVALQQALQNDPRLTAPQRASRLQQHLETRFDDAEQRRLQAWLAEGWTGPDGG